MKIPPAVDVPAIIYSFAISVVLGLIFGVYPAKRQRILIPLKLFGTNSTLGKFLPGVLMPPFYGNGIKHYKLI